jgi:DNA polymerase-3 subunit gamma/tau
MENFIVSARKYRPVTFASVVGQHSITQTLKNSIANNYLGQAYLFCGPRGVGKTTCARIFAKTINCMNLSSDVEACDECESCKAFNESASFNIHELDAASNNSVEDIRTLIDQVRISPQIGKYSIYIIDEVHMLSTAAFNAFLKTLEEPPKHAIFILATTEKHKILPTILSRCQIFDFQRIRVEDMVEHLASVASQEHIPAEREALNVIALKADGGLRDALSIFDQIASFSNRNITYQSTIDNLNVLDYEYFFKLTDCCLKEDYVTALLIYDQILDKGFEGNNFLSGLTAHFRNVLVSKDPQTVQLLEVGDAIRERYLQQAHNCTVDFLYKAMNFAAQFDEKYKQSNNKRLHVELALLHISNILKKKALM